MKPLTVTEVNRIIKYKIKEIPQFSNVYVVGEITNFNERSRFGHWYFSLKDENGSLSCNMFMNYQKGVKFEPSNGMKVICCGYIDVYEKNGAYQLYVMSMNTVGAGDDMLALEELKKKLTAEGLFDAAHKKPLPKYPRKIGIVTSATGAAVEDLKTNISRRWGLSEIVIAPTLVQGDKAPADIVKSISALDKFADVDVIIVGRGGGANDDLKAFNTEAVARAVYNCKTPVISAVGHQVDYSLCDAAADVSVPTPSTAAEIVVPDKNEELRAIDDMYSDIESIIKMKLEREENRIRNYMHTFDSKAFYEKLEHGIENSQNKLITIYGEIVNNRDFKIRSLADKLNALSPLAVIGRGYSITMKNNSVLKTVDGVNKNDNLTIKLSDGSINASVNEVNKNE